MGGTKSHGGRCFTVARAPQRQNQGGRVDALRPSIRPLGSLLRQTTAGALSKLKGNSDHGLCAHQACWVAGKWQSGRRGGKGGGASDAGASAAGVGNRKSLTRLVDESNTVLVRPAMMKSGWNSAGYTIEIV